jgi:superfamily II DNA helicase RecQ
MNCLNFAGAVRVVCATIAFGLGMDLPNIALVIHWDAADSMVDFVQQTGRGGRDGSPCLCVTMYDRAEMMKRQRRFTKNSVANKRSETVDLQQVLLTTQPHRVSVLFISTCAHDACVVQVQQWYESTMMCRHAFVEDHFSIDEGDECNACGSRCDYCLQQCDGMSAIVGAFQAEHYQM